MKVKAIIRIQDDPSGYYWPKEWEIEREHSFGNEEHSAHSYMLVCPTCLRIWAYHVLAGDHLVWPSAGFCSRCPQWIDNLHPVPGTIFLQEGLDVIDDGLLEALPLELLKREFNLHEKALESWTKQQTFPYSLASTSS